MKIKTKNNNDDDNSSSSSKNNKTISSSSNRPGGYPPPCLTTTKKKPLLRPEGYKIIWDGEAFLAIRVQARQAPTTLDVDMTHGSCSGKRRLFHAVRNIDLRTCFQQLFNHVEVAVLCQVNQGLNQGWV